MASLCYVNGIRSNSIQVQDRGLSYGDGLFETVLYRKQQCVLLDLHLARLIQGCKRLSIALDQHLLHEQLSGFLAQAELQQSGLEGIIKITVTRGIGGRGYAPAETNPTLVIAWHQLPALSTTDAITGVSATVCKMALGKNMALAGLKHLNRLEQVLASIELDGNNFNEGLLCDTDGNVIEAISKNIFFIENGVLTTPSLECSGVSGVMRQYIMSDVAQALNITVSEQAIAVEDITSFQEAFLCNSVVGVLPLNAIDQCVFAVGDVTRSIQQYVAKDLYA